MIRVNKQLNIALSPLSLSPCNHKETAKIKPRKGASPKEIQKADKRAKMVGQTSIEDLNANNIVLNSSADAIANEKSPRSSGKPIDTSSSSDIQEDFVYE